MGNKPNRSIQSVETTCKIFDVLRRKNGATPTELANNVELSPGTVHTYLATLRSEGYVTYNNGLYKLAPPFVTFGEYVRNQSILYQAAKEEVDRLAKKSEEAVHLIVEHQGRGIALYEAFGDEAVGSEYHMQLRQKPHQLLHCTASGKAILAHLSADRIDEILDNHGLARVTENTVTDQNKLKEQLAEIRDQGYAINDEEEMLGVYAVGTAIKDRNGNVLGSIAISAPKSRVNIGESPDDLKDMVVRAGNIVEVNLQTANL